MKSFRLYLIGFIVFMTGYVIYEMTKPKEIHWMLTFEDLDKNPFGLFILNERSEDLFGEKMGVSYLTLSQMNKQENVLILANDAKILEADFSKLMEMLNEGKNVLIGANRYSNLLMDSLKFNASFKFNMYGIGLNSATTTHLEIKKKRYYYPMQMLSNHFVLEDGHDWKILAKTKEGPAAIQKQVGKGTLTLVTNPEIFSNYGLLYNENYVAAKALLTSLPMEKIHYTKYYQSGRPSASTPLRYFLREPALKWATYISLFLIVALLGIDSWRKQRKIEIIEPLKNESVRYAKTLGGLYYREGNHYKTAMKIISHFYGMIRERYFMEPEFTEKFYTQLSSKANLSRVHVEQTFKLIELVRKNPAIEEKKLVELSKKIDLFR